MNEFFQNLWRARAWRRGMGALRGDGERIAFHATDTAERWLVLRHPRGFEWSHRSDGCPPSTHVTVNGPVELVYLLAWKRVALDDPGLAIDGGPDVLRYWYRHGSV